VVGRHLLRGPAVLRFAGRPAFPRALVAVGPVHGNAMESTLYAASSCSPSSHTRWSSTSGRTARSGCMHTSRSSFSFLSLGPLLHVKGKSSSTSTDSGGTRSSVHRSSTTSVPARSPRSGAGSASSRLLASCRGGFSLRALFERFERAKYALRRLLSRPLCSNIWIPEDQHTRRTDSKLIEGIARDPLT